jgi:DeoR/GlpR family transcriptional regulator of sugar metabolism
VAKLIDVARRNKIVNYVLGQGQAKVSELAEHCGVSTETIRKDLSSLHERNILHKGHGVATPASAFVENQFAVKEVENAEAKNIIAKKAAEIIPEHAVIFIDSGTTALQLARVLNIRNDLNIITSSMIVPVVMQASGNQILVTGGEFRRNSLSYVGTWANRAVQRVKVDIAFLGCDGFHDDGPSIRSYRELELKETIVSNAAQSVVLADSGKLTKQGLYCFADFSAIDLIFMERNVSDKEISRFSTDISPKLR